MNDVQMHSMGIASSLPKTNDEDDDSLPDITLYPFDAIVDTVKVSVGRNIFESICTINVSKFNRRAMTS